jgi:hypothetical protein
LINSPPLGFERDFLEALVAEPLVALGLPVKNGGFVCLSFLF